MAFIPVSICAYHSGLKPTISKGHRPAELTGHLGMLSGNGRKNTGLALIVMRDWSSNGDSAEQWNARQPQETPVSVILCAQNAPVSKPYIESGKLLLDAGFNFYAARVDVARFDVLPRSWRLTA